MLTPLPPPFFNPGDVHAKEQLRILPKIDFFLNILKLNGYDKTYL